MQNIKFYSHSYLSYLNAVRNLSGRMESQSFIYWEYYGIGTITHVGRKFEDWKQLIAKMLWTLFIKKLF